MIVLSLALSLSHTYLIQPEHFTHTHLDIIICNYSDPLRGSVFQGLRGGKSHCGAVSSSAWLQ